MTAIWGTAALITSALNKFLSLGTGLWLLLCYFLVVILSVAAIRLIFALSPIRPGVLDKSRHPERRFAYNLIGLILLTNLHFQTSTTLLPMPLRTLYYRLLGLKLPDGFVAILGNLTDPWLVTIEGDAMIGAESMILCHGMLASDTMVFAPVKVGRGAMIGARAVIMPGVEIGAGATINASAHVAMNTKIGPGEVWGGNPAKRLG